MTTLYLIRHGENDWIGRRLPGWTRGLHLNERGRAQAQALSEVMAPVRLSAIYSSPLERALETARPLARARGLRVERRLGLGEVRVGSWQGQPLRRLRRRKLWPIIQFAPSQARFPGGESFVEAQARVVAELESICRRHRSPRSAVACFTHADIIKLAVAHYLGLALDLFQRLAVDPASVTVVRVQDGRAVVVRLNDGRVHEIIKPG